jgi:hypothetical protein
VTGKATHALAEKARAAPGQLFGTRPVLSEREWQTTIQRGLTREDWTWQHVYRMQDPHGRWRTSTTAVGWPDLVCFRGAWILAIECKSAKGKATPQQLAWLARFAEIPTGRAWLLSPTATDWQALANWLRDPENAPRVHGFDLPSG